MTKPKEGGELLLNPLERVTSAYQELAFHALTSMLHMRNEEK